MQVGGSSTLADIELVTFQLIKDLWSLGMGNERLDNLHYDYTYVSN